MNRKSLVICLLACVCTFFLGWTLHWWMKPNASKQLKTSGLPGQKSLQPDITTNTFFKGPTGRFILEESHCAGFDFINNNTVLWTNELFCNDPDTLKLSWLSDSIFMTRSTFRTNENCPPKVGIYKIIILEEQQLILRDIWTGWYDAKATYLRLVKKSI